MNLILFRIIMEFNLIRVCWYSSWKIKDEGLCVLKKFLAMIELNLTLGASYPTSPQTTVTNILRRYIH